MSLIIPIHAVSLAVLVTLNGSSTSSDVEVVFERRCLPGPGCCDAGGGAK
jgi:hypothetical protein